MTFWLRFGALCALFTLACVTEPDTPSRADDLRTRFDLRPLGAIPYPPDNQPNPARIELGQLLFFDPILGGERDVACSTCHHPNFAFTDRRQFSAGVSGRGLGPDRVLSASLFTGHPVTETPRNSQTVLNVAYARDESGQPSYAAPLFWDGRVRGFEQQALDPIASRVEMRGDAFPGTDADAAAVAVDSVLERLRNIPAYVERFLAAFPNDAARLGGDPGPAVVDSSTLARALAAFQRELVTGVSPYDRFVAGDDFALTDAQLAGLEIFLTTGQCATCHAPPTFASFGYFVTGVPSAGTGKKVIPGDDAGREEHTLVAGDRYAFRPPSLREAVLTPPYMHSGVFATLEDVVQFYSNGARPRHANIGDRDLHPTLQQPLNLSAAEQASLVDFLRSLTGFDAVRDRPLFAEPELVPSGLTDRYGTAFDKVVMARITSGGWHSCAISGVGSGVPNGTVYCWGRNDHGQLGNGAASSEGFRPNPQRVLNPASGSGVEGEQGELVRFLRLALGADYSCGLADGRLFCWGGEPVGRNTTRPVLIQGDIDFRAIAGGDQHLCALDGGGVLYCLGNNDSGQLGNGSRTSSEAPVAIGGITFAEVAAGGSHTCAITSDGAGYCWGSNEYGQLGDGSPPGDVVRPTAVVGGHSFIELSTGVEHTCGLTQDGEAFCWGRNDFGQLGMDTTTAFSATPLKIAGNHVFETIAAGYHHTCGATHSKAVYCWGSNAFGQLGTERLLAEIQIAPDSVHTDLPLSELAAGRHHTCSTSNELGFCWGGNQYGQVGNGGTLPNLVPKRVVGPP